MSSSARGFRVPLTVRILLGMGLGVAVGLIFGASAARLSLFGTLIIDLIKGLAGPYLFCLVLLTFLTTRIEAKAAGRMIAISLVNGAIALTIGLTISNVLQPGKSFDVLAEPEAVARAKAELAKLEKSIEPDQTIDFVKDIFGHVPTSFVRPFLDGSVLSIVILAIFAGLALRAVRASETGEGREGVALLEAIAVASSKALERIIEWVILLVPLAVFGVVAKTVGQYGLGVFRGLGVYLAVGLAGLAIQVFVVYQLWLVVVARMPLRKFWAAAKEPVVFAMGVGSSNATIPKTLAAFDRLGISRASARMAACVGTNLNNDGILLYEAMAVLFVAQAIGEPMSLGRQLIAAASCAIAGVGISGIPEAGLISLVLVLQTVKLPSGMVEEILPILLTVDWVLGRARAMTNVSSDLLVGVLLDRFGGVKSAAGEIDPDTNEEARLE
ncbi:MAG: dicarboxylate/amino acid:cation symporter [Isosphaeraceae bacterium]|nr:dicarboxylate/amino acid:cation symporter [Isosphaeraceae bacterium]